MTDRIRRTLAAYLPDQEPPLRASVDDVIRQARRRRRSRVILPVTAFATLLTIGMGWVTASVGTGPDSWTRPPDQHTASSKRPSATPSASASQPPGTPTTRGNGKAPSDPEPLRFQPPQEHHLNDDAAASTKLLVDQLPADKVAAWYGTRSDHTGPRGGYNHMKHVLWRDNGHYAYFLDLYRTANDFQMHLHGLPGARCLTGEDPLPGEICKRRTLNNGEVVVRFEVNRGYRVRGFMWNQSNGKRLTAGFVIPKAGEPWPHFPQLTNAPRLTEVPLTWQEIEKLYDMPQ